MTNNAIPGAFAPTAAIGAYAFVREGFGSGRIQKNSSESVRIAELGETVRGSVALGLTLLFFLGLIYSFRPIPA